MNQVSYIQYLGGYFKENVTIEDIRKAIKDLEKMDDEHDAFWVSVVKKEENILETRKDLSVIGVFEDDFNTELRKQYKDIQDIQNLYSLLLNENFEELKLQLKSI